MIQVENLTKRYGSHTAVDNISFQVGEGEILGFLGPNGAGKSTTMNILTGYLSSTCGTARINGHDILEEPMAAKASIGYLPEIPPLYTDMTVKEYLNFIYDLKKCTLPRAEHLAEICSVMKITDRYGRLIKNLSKGYRQRVGFAQALIGNPPILILDEPTVGLDPNQIIEMRSLIKKLGKHHTVILSSHILPEVEAVCDRVCIISQGHIVADDTPDNLSKQFSDEPRLTVRIAGPETELPMMLRDVPGVRRVVNHGRREAGVYEYLLELEPDADVRAVLFTRLAERGWPIMGMASNEMTLEDIFIALTREQDFQKGGDPK